MEPTWVQHGTNLSQLGANLGPCWVHIASSRPSCSNYEGILRPPWAYMTQDAKNNPKIVEFCSKKCQKLVLPKLPKSKITLENVGPEANREKTTMKLKPINFEFILEPFWLHLGVHLSQHKAILSHLGANLKPPGANISPT